MLNKQINSQDILGALTFIDKNGVPANRRSTKYNLYHNSKPYPPKYVLSIATKLATGRELKPSQFNGGVETNHFLSLLGFTIREGSKNLQDKKAKPTTNIRINICTAVIQSQDTFETWNNTSNNEKIELLKDILKVLGKDTDILILPAGYLNSKSKKPETLFSEVEKKIVDLINKSNTNLFICFGIDGRRKADQLALTINKKGIVAIARKFHHKDNSVHLADNAFTTEHNKQRYFTIKGKHPYLAVCYDIFGIPHNKLDNKNNYDFIIGVIHGFGHSGGDSDFARKGLAGASKQWKVHSYASAVFSDNRNSTNWPSGVKWTHGNASVRDFKYDDIRINGQATTLDTDLGVVHLQRYKE